MDLGTIKQKDSELTSEYLRIRDDLFKIGEEFCRLININYNKVKPGTWKEEKNCLLLSVVYLREGEKPTRKSISIATFRLNSDQRTRYEDLCKTDK